MQLRALQTFVEVAKAESLRQAAQRLGTTPTAISRQIDNVEHYFGAQLLDRSSSGIRLTEAGSLLAAHAQTVVNDLVGTRRLIDDLKRLERGQATIRAGGAVVGGLLAPVLCKLNESHPGLRFHIDVDSATEVFNGVAEGSADLGLTIFSPQSEKVEILYSRQIDHAIIVRSDHPLARRSDVPLSELVSHPLALPDRRFGARQTLERLAASQDVSLDPAFVTGSLEIQKELAVRGSAALLLPPLCCQRELELGLLSAVTLAEGSRIVTTLELCAAPNRRLSFAGLSLMKGLTEYMGANLILPRDCSSS